MLTDVALRSRVGLWLAQRADMPKDDVRASGSGVEVVGAFGLKGLGSGFKFLWHRTAHVFFGTIDPQVMPRRDPARATCQKARLLARLT